jgi:signal transduction histidine kinase
MNFQALADQSWRSGAYLSIAVTLVIGMIDYLSGIEISWSVIYVLPIAMAVWSVGPGFAYALSILSIGLWLAGDFADGLRVSSWIVPVWNASIRLMLYHIIIQLLVYSRSQANVLENKVLQRTEDLRKEKAELRREIAQRTRLERELLAAGERERRRLGYDLHDGLGQHLTGTALVAQILREKLAKRGSPEAEDAMKTVALIEQGIELSHQLAKGLQPVDMQAGGLMEALQEFASATASLFKISCKFECDSPVVIADLAAAENLYRIVQEATSNAIKHGRATVVVISLDLTEEGILLRITDNGTGLPQPAPIHKGLGLRIMEQRAKLIGGDVRLRSSGGGGTVVTCSIGAASTSLRENRVAEQA